MRTHSIVVGALLFGVLGACARGYEADPVRGEAPLRMPEMPIRAANDPLPPDAGPAEPAYTGESCMRGEETPCTCAGGLDGIKTCQFDPASPTQGTFSECQNCVAPDDPDPTGGDVSEPDAGPGVPGAASDCADGMQNGDETDVDCGGPDCPSCLIGRGCNTTDDCSAGECMSGTCELPSDSGGGTVGGGSCMPACTNSCFPVGILPCCNPLGRCGCTWAPGAYCL